MGTNSFSRFRSEWLIVYVDEKQARRWRTVMLECRMRSWVLEVKHKPGVEQQDCNLLLPRRYLANWVSVDEHNQLPVACIISRSPFLILSLEKYNKKMTSELEVQNFFLLTGLQVVTYHTIIFLCDRRVNKPCSGERETCPLFLPAIIQFSDLASISYNTSSSCARNKRYIASLKYKCMDND